VEQLQLSHSRVVGRRVKAGYTPGRAGAFITVNLTRKQISRAWRRQHVSREIRINDV